MTATRTKWLVVGLLCLALWPADASPQDGVWHGSMADGTEAYLQGHYAEAEEQFAAALERAEGFGPQDPRLAMSLNGLAGVYRAQGKDAEAEPLYKRALAIAETALGPEHPYVAVTLENYAALLRKTGQSAEAQKREARAEAIRARRANKDPAD